MKISVNNIPPEGLSLEENIESQSLDLDTDIIKFREPIGIKAKVQLITNAINVEVTAFFLMHSTCSRCLNDFEIKSKKDFRLNYQVESPNQVIDFNPDIRQEIILDYPIKSLCSSACKGLCPKCGKNLNEGKCNC